MFWKYVPLFPTKAPVPFTESFSYFAVPLSTVLKSQFISKLKWLDNKMWNNECEFQEIERLVFTWWIFLKNCHLRTGSKPTAVFSCPENCPPWMGDFQTNIALSGAKSWKWVFQKWGLTRDGDISNPAINPTAIYKKYTVFITFRFNSMRCYIFSDCIQNKWIRSNVTISIIFIAKNSQPAKADIPPNL